MLSTSAPQLNVSCSSDRRVFGASLGCFMLIQYCFCCSKSKRVVHPRHDIQYAAVSSRVKQSKRCYLGTGGCRWCRWVQRRAVRWFGEGERWSRSSRSKLRCWHSAGTDAWWSAGAWCKQTKRIYKTMNDLCKLITTNAISMQNNATVTALLLYAISVQYSILHIPFVLSTSLCNNWLILH